MRAGELDLCSEAEVKKLKRNKLLQPCVILACCRGMVAKGMKTELKLNSVKSPSPLKHIS